MNTIEKVLDMTTHIRKYIENGQAASAARKYNGVLITTTLDYHGIICAYLEQNDLWIYWIETGVLTHYKDNIQASRIVGEVTNQIRHDREGVESVIVPKAYREQFMALNIGPLTKKKKAAAKQTEAVVEKAPKVLFNGGVYDITIADMGTIRVIGKNADDAWNVLRESCQIDMVA